MDSGVIYIFDFLVIFGAAIVGGIVTVVGSVIVLGKKATEPKNELRQKVNNLEKEIEELKGRK
ncbi:hypothetical protein [Lentibacillus jeotgali]|uniref:hypothetical protein n=1 Tax=Lentibacillus jeotgali TaxID=558169 RepID=UPI0004948386|nr:hypothetical protein [Lentibacillus jeotgali]